MALNVGGTVYDTDGQPVDSTTGGAVLTVVSGERGKPGATGPAGPTGPVGASGATGASGPVGDYYRHVQGSPATTWTVPNPLGRPVTVTVVDSAGSEIVGDVVHRSDTELVIEFSAPFAGEAFLT